MTTTSTTADKIPGDLSPELVPVVEPGTLALTFPQPEGPGNKLEFGDILSDALFGEVIDISDLIPRVLSPSTETLASQLPVEAELHMPDGVDVLGAFGHAASALTILYDDGILTSDGVV